MRARTDSAAVHELVDLLEIGAVGAAESMLAHQGLCPPPTMHVISGLPDAPYVGYVVARPFTGGQDATRAVAGMGLLPAVMRARRLVLTWEHHDLCAALELPGRAQPAVVVVDAGPEGHEVRWHPYSMQLGPCSEPVAPTVAVPDWGQSRREPGGWLPDPVTRLLATWREAATRRDYARCTRPWRRPTTPSAGSTTPRDPGVPPRRSTTCRWAADPVITGRAAGGPGADSETGQQLFAPGVQGAPRDDPP